MKLSARFDLFIYSLQKKKTFYFKYLSNSKHVIFSEDIIPSN